MIVLFTLLNYLEMNYSGYFNSVTVANLVFWFLLFPIVYCIKLRYVISQFTKSKSCQLVIDLQIIN